VAIARGGAARDRAPLHSLAPAVRGEANAGQIEVRVIPHDSTRARVLIENKTINP